MSNHNLHALVDMGSNGIRLSITDMTLATARIVPTVFTDRIKISLYDVQHQNNADLSIPDTTTEQIIRALLRFKKTCDGFGVPLYNIQILATEATRTAANSEEFQEKIGRATGWKIRLLDKQEEGELGAYGIASSFSAVHGVSMDLGGGSTQLSWIHTDGPDSQICPYGAVSLPYGAAALSDLVKEVANNGNGGEETLLEKLADELHAAIAQVCPREELAATSESKGLNLYVSGGGLRGWGYLLMACSKIQPYPIPIINGFAVDAAEFDPNSALEKYDALGDEKKGLFRISKRRRSQIPAIAFLITALSRAMPISRVYFSQGGVREGYHFQSLESSVQQEHPLICAARAGGHGTGDALKLLRSALPGKRNTLNNHSVQLPTYLAQLDGLVCAFAHLMNAHAGLAKDIRAAAALRSTSTGLLAGAHGLTHLERAWLGVALCQRWGEELAPTDRGFYDSLLKILGGYNTWWARYIGTVAAGVAHCYPAGKSHDEGFALKVRWAGENVISIEILLHKAYHNEMEDETLPDWIRDLERLGRKKHWVDGKGIRTLIYEQFRS